MEKLTRRNFLKLSAAGAGGGSLLLAAGLAPTEAAGGLDLHKKIGEVSTICPYCSCGCGLIMATNAEGHVTNCEGDPDNPTNRGALDTKSISLPQLLNSPLRLKNVMYRAPGSTEWEVKTWDWAIAEITKRIKKTRDDSWVSSVKVNDKDVAVNRTEGLAWLGGAANSSEDCYLAVKFARSLGMVYIEHQARLCHSSTVAALSATYNRGAMTNDWVDVKNSDSVLVIGANPAENHPASMGWVNQARDKNGAKLIVVDPRFTRTAATADCYASLRSGTDIVFLGALISYTIQNKLYNDDYVKYYTNALTLINPDFKGPADLDGFFSGYNADQRSYDRKTWAYQTESRTVTVTQKDPQTGENVSVQKQVAVPMQAASLDDPNSVFAHLTKHYARYTPAMVEKICGTPQADFLQVAKLYCDGSSAPDKSGTVFYAMGQTQHTIGTQNIRAIGILQLLLGNIGVPGGGVNALRGESNVQGSTDMGLLYGSLPGYLDAPSQAEPDFQTYANKSKYSKTSYWANGPAFFKSLMRAWYGDAASAANDYAYNYLPKSSANYSFINLFEAMYAGTVKGLICMGMNPAVGGPNSRFERRALQNLDWLVAMDLFETETASFWKGPGINPADIQTEVFLLPAADAAEKAGSVATSGRRLQWRLQAAPTHGDTQQDIWILSKLMSSLKESYKDSTAAKDRPILDVVWDYGDPPDVELVAKEVNGFAVDDINDASGAAVAKKGDVLDAYAKIVSAADPSKIACGCWIYTGYFFPRDDGTGTKLPSVKRRGQDDPGNMGFYPNWGWTWPSNRRILYNRASAKPDGTPWAENKKIIWWDPNADSGTKDAQGNPILGKWAGYDVPDFSATKSPTSKADFAKTGLSAQNGTDPFIMASDGKGWLFGPLNEGPFPEHYEPAESPVKNLMSSVQSNPVIKIWITDADKSVGDAKGTADKFPIICTTYRLTEMWQTGTMTRTLPWLAELQPNMFVEVGKELAAEKGIKNGGQVVVSSARGEIQMVALVTARWKPFIINGQTVHEIGMPWHYGWQGLATGAIANDLTAHVGDGNTSIPEYKAFLVDIRKA